MKVFQISQYVGLIKGENDISHKQKKFQDHTSKNLFEM